MGDVIRLVDRVKTAEAHRFQQESHCSCEIAPPPEQPPRLTFTVFGWICSACHCIIKGVNR